MPLGIPKTKLKADVNYQNSINWPQFLLELINYYYLIMVLFYLDLSLRYPYPNKYCVSFYLIQTFSNAA